MSIFERTERLLGEAGVRKLQSASVAIFGIGGVGGFAAEALARAGVGRLLLVDADTVAESNINRQIIADHSTVGRYKTEVMAERIGRINPEASVETRNVFYLPEDHGGITLAGFDYVIDAVDTVAAKLEIIVEAQAAGVPFAAAGWANDIPEIEQFMRKNCGLYFKTVRELQQYLFGEVNP